MEFRYWSLDGEYPSRTYAKDWPPAGVTRRQSDLGEAGPGGRHSGHGRTTLKEVVVHQSLFVLLILAPEGSGFASPHPLTVTHCFTRGSTQWKQQSWVGTFTL